MASVLDKNASEKTSDEKINVITVEIEKLQNKRDELNAEICHSNNVLKMNNEKVLQQGQLIRQGAMCIGCVTTLGALFGSFLAMYRAKH